MRFFKLLSFTSTLRRPIAVQPASETIATRLSPEQEVERRFVDMSKCIKLHCALLAEDMFANLTSHSQERIAKILMREFAQMSTLYAKAGKHSIAGCKLLDSFIPLLDEKAHFVRKGLDEKRVTCPRTRVILEQLLEDIVAFKSWIAEEHRLSEIHRSESVKPPIAAVQ